MQRRSIDTAKLKIQPHELFHHQRVLLAAGDFEKGHFNAMTIGWGAIGTMWSKPFALVAVRHSRYTYQFMERYDTFTLSAFPDQYHEALSLLGSRSGRDGDKIAAARITPETSIKVPAPSFQEADFVIECRKTYADDLNPAHFMDERIYSHYPNREYHCIYYGEILVTSVTDKYIS